MAWRAMGRTDEEFLQMVRLAIFGDDHVVTVSKKVPEFNMLYLQKFARSIGMTYTTSTKEEVSIPYVPLPDLEYLKRKFVLTPSRWVLAPLNLASILEIPMWRNESETLEDELNSWRSVFQELRHHPRKYYDQMLHVLTRYSKVRGFTLPIQPYEQAYASLLRT